MRKLSVFLLTVIGFMVAMTVWFLPNIYGQYRFSQFCGKDSGFHEYGEIEKNSPWLTTDQADAKSVVSTHAMVPFARYLDRDGQYFDVRYKGGNPWWDSSYEVISADLKIVVPYIFEYKASFIEKELRLRKDVYSLRDRKTNQVIFQHTGFAYTLFESKHTLLGQSDIQTCPAFESQTANINAFLLSGNKT
ncbi:hypothetical protein [Undibacterium umbellatum]|uniref:Uncharacterized protein n=1 Tax=Undibacterium umbellatum TaxID=2762300 RepID=A0ABR6ZFY0_9BURK|nr:hypothetical protein [Undibacterium umbellatum]MBC3910588.1 hypothetical protein [Undibacterium umbellatum]